MAFRPLLRQRFAPVCAAVAGSAAPITLANQPTHDSLTDAALNRKPIYDDVPLDTTAPAPTQPAAPSTPASDAPYRPTPTDRLAVQIGKARLALYQQSARAEDGVNNALTETLRLEHSFTSTIRSPGATEGVWREMTRNRNILLRATVPAAIGIGAAYAVLPITMKNVGDLAWKYEERYPVLADAHLRTKERLARFWETGKAHSAMSVGMIQDKVAETRSNMEDWVKKGR
ncbi:uncharacterized protein N0V89_009669 [Didymosphaeria variabile]|uniref:MICOS complex subunit n=1 Tax=Didymosphaeria variabile TaxID=1932322 RepID=A0A9W9C6S7_9PLEO|nr:uncharacterized protein N0V89_009669 [Didymosphaeria variabile]KAJ4348297.1 hypothetical protein N0V89_009669 [Didymosphaeria variabile]